MATIFVSGAHMPRTLERLAEVARGHDVIFGPGGLGAAEWREAAPRVDALLASVRDRVDDAVLAEAPRLKLVANVAVGVDNVDVAACRARGVVVTNTPGVLTEATADLAFALVLAACRRVAEGDRLVRAGGWTGFAHDLLLGRSVHGATLGILGLGRIGQAVARRARGFGMHILYHQRTPLPDGLARALGATFVSTLDELCANVDILSIHSPLTAETRGLFDARRLALFRRGAVLVNTSRGPIVDEAALANALREGPLAAAGIDVFEAEPKVHPALLACENAVLTPHIGSAEATTRAAMADMAVENLRRVLAGEPPLSAV